MKIRCVLFSMLLTLLMSTAVLAANDELYFGDPVLNDDKTVDLTYVEQGDTFYWCPGIEVFYTTETDPGTVTVQTSSGGTDNAKVDPITTGYLVRYTVPKPGSYIIGDKQFTVNNLTKIAYECSLPTLDDIAMNNIDKNVPYVYANYDACIIRLKTPDLITDGYMCNYWTENTWGVEAKVKDGTWKPCTKTEAFVQSKGYSYYALPTNTKLPLEVRITQPDPENPIVLTEDGEVTSTALVYWDADSINSYSDKHSIKLRYGTASSGSNATTWKSDTTGVTTYTLYHENGDEIAHNKTGEFDFTPTDDEILTVKTSNPYGLESTYQTYVRVFTDPIETSAVKHIGETATYTTTSKYTGEVAPQNTQQTKTTTYGVSDLKTETYESAGMTPQYFWYTGYIWPHYDEVVGKGIISKTYDKPTYAISQTTTVRNKLISDQWSYFNKQTTVPMSNAQIQQYGNMIQLVVESPRSRTYAENRWLYLFCNTQQDTEGNKTYTDIKDTWNNQKE